MNKNQAVQADIRDARLMLRRLMTYIELISFTVPIPVLMYFVFTSFTFLHANILKFLTSLGTIVTGLKQSVAVLGRSSQSLDGTSGGLRERAVTLGGSAETTARTATGMRGDMDRLSAGAREYADNARNESDAVTAMTRGIVDIAAGITVTGEKTAEAVHAADSAGHDITTLLASTADIDRVVEIVDDIAEQITLLSLNATIQASKAGTAGATFMVVATEIKELATRTGASIADVARSVAAIRQSSTAVAANMEKISAVIKAINETLAALTSAVGLQESAAGRITRLVDGNLSRLTAMTGGIEQAAAQARRIVGGSGAVTADAAGVQQESETVSPRACPGLHPPAAAAPPATV